MSASAQTAAARKIADDAPLVEVGYAPNVIVALLRVMRDLPGIDKDQTAAAQQGGYAYRGIEQITRHTQGLFASHGVVFAPRVVHHEIRDLTVNNKPWTDTVELVEYDVYGPGGIEDRITIGPILAIGRDNSDKGANKCMTQAFKYALLQALSISDAKDDADGETHEADLTPTGRPRTISAKSMAKATLLELCEGDKAKAKEAWVGIGGDRVAWDGESVATVKDRFLAWVNEDPAEGEQ
jgi:hypothetical protein